jgi:predicted O-methyltransferase YrrM
MNDVNFLIEKTKFGDGDSDRHLMSLYSIALGSKSKNIIELGVRNGDTTLPLALAAKDNNGHLYSVDINETSYTFSLHELIDLINVFRINYCSWHPVSCK